MLNDLGLAYAVKELRNAWGEPRWLEWLDEGWRLENACLANVGGDAAVVHSDDALGVAGNLLFVGDHH